MAQSIDDKKLAKLTNIIDNKNFYGASQSWYPTYIKRMGGCAPTAASNLLACALERIDFSTKEHCLDVMQTMWKFVKPGFYGVNKVESFVRGSNEFFKKYGLPFVCVYLKYAKHKKPPFEETVDFIKAAFAHNCPVAFLNLSNGNVEKLESWHWVTVVRMTDDKIITVFDGETSFDMDLLLWHTTTTHRGGFAYYLQLQK